jgi:ATP-dependent Clp protease adapter protein ClpS
VQLSQREIWGWLRTFVKMVTQEMFKGNFDKITGTFCIVYKKGKAICIYASIRYYQLDKGSATGAGSC